MSVGTSTSIYLHGHTFDEVYDLLAAFKHKGVDNIKEMIKLTEDLDATVLEYKAQALAAEAKLNRIKTFLKD